MDGWIKLHRKLKENPIYTNSVAVHCWIECLFRATHKEKTMFINREQIQLKEGQFIFGRKEFAKSIKTIPSTACFWLRRFNIDSMVDIKKIGIERSIIRTARGLRRTSSRITTANEPPI